MTYDLVEDDLANQFVAIFCENDLADMFAAILLENDLAYFFLAILSALQFWPL